MGDITDDFILLEVPDPTDANGGLAPNADNCGGGRRAVDSSPPVLRTCLPARCRSHLPCSGTSSFAPLEARDPPQKTEASIPAQDGGSPRKEDDPSSWSCDLVQTWAKASLAANTAKALWENRVNGQTLLTLTTKDIRDELGIVSLTDRRQLWAALQELRGGGGGAKDEQDDLAMVKRLQLDAYLEQQQVSDDQLMAQRFEEEEKRRQLQLAKDQRLAKSLEWAY